MSSAVHEPEPTVLAFRYDAKGILVRCDHTGPKHRVLRGVLDPSPERDVVLGGHRQEPLFGRPLMLPARMPGRDGDS
jgi:hypothetical protein